MGSKTALRGLNMRRLLGVMLMAGALLPATALRAAGGVQVQQVKQVQREAPGSRLVENGSFASAALGRSMRYRVILPEGYGTSGRRYPTLYLLHGLWGAYDNWETHTDIFLHSRPFDLIIVMPEGEDSWYTDSQGEPKDKFETYIVKDLVDHIDKTYRTLQTRHGRAIAGLSMGGYGALKFGLKFPDEFSFVGSFSGALAAGQDPAFIMAPDTNVGQRFRTIYGAAGSKTRAENDIFALVEKAKLEGLPFFYLDCGADDGFLDVNRQFVALLQKKKVAYEYREGPGAHAWDYWDRQVRGMLAVLAARMPQVVN
jgi:putative tributyrin esterase